MARLDLPQNSAAPAADYVRKGCSTLFYSVFALAGFIFLGVFIYSFFQTARPYFWTKTPCTIVESYRPKSVLEQQTSLEPSETKKIDRRDVVIRYRYNFRNEEHTSDVFIRGMKESLSSSKIEKVLLRYQTGTRTTCYVNPSKPEEAALERGQLWVMLFSFIPLIFIAMGVFGIIGVWRKKPWKSSPTKKKADLGKLFPFIFFGLFALVGGLVGYFLTVRPIMTYFDARSWPETPCEILQSKVGTHSSKDGSTYSVDIEYRYRVDDREYQSDRYSILGGSSSGRSGKEEVVARYPQGSQAVCFVNPKDPTDALLSREASLLWLIGLVPAVFFIVGISGLFGALRSLLKSSGKVKLPGSSSGGGLPGIPSVPVMPPTVPGAPTASGGGMELQSSASPMTKLAGAMFIAVFWNGITGVFVWFAAQSWIKGNPQYFLTLFITPFVLIGLGLLGLVGYTFLNLFNPRVRMTVSNTSLTLGGTLNLQWQFTGAVGRLQNLKITLEGREEARYRRGTDNVVDKHVFIRIPVFETIDSRMIAQGSAQFTVPENLMHTWDGGNNKIIWELKLHGEIPRFPDVSEEYPMTILPKPV